MAKLKNYLLKCAVFVIKLIIALEKTGLKLTKNLNVLKSVLPQMGCFHVKVKTTKK